MSIVSYEVAHTPGDMSFGQRMKVHGELMEHGEVVPHPKVLDEGDELARRFNVRASAREALEEHASEATRRGASSLVPFVSCTGTTQANERKRQCEDGIWDPRLWIGPRGSE